MGSRLLRTACAVAMLGVVACSGQTSEMSGGSGNGLLAEWEGPYGGVPAFDRMNLDELRPALEKGMEIQLSEIDAIARVAA